MNYLEFYESYEEVLAAAQGPSQMTENERASRKPSKRSWDNGYTWNKALDTARTGDIDGAKRLSPEIIALANKLILHTSRFDPEVKLDGGTFIDVARYVNGEPECWVEMVENNKAPKQGLTLVVNIGANSQVKAEELDRVAENIGGAVVGLQAGGCPVTVLIAHKCTSSNWGNEDSVYTMSFPLNPAGRMLNIAQLSAILSPWFFRRIYFSLAETYDKDMREAMGFVDEGGYGRSSKLTVSEIKSLITTESHVVINVNELVYRPYRIMELIEASLKQEVAQ
jgi:hypothetical protein